MRVRCNARDYVVVTNDYTCNVRTVRAAEGIYVRIVICVVKTVGHFFVDINVFCRKALNYACRKGIAQIFCNVFLGHAKRGRRELFHAERGVRVVRTGIEYGDDNARTVVSRFGAIENTRFVNGNVVFYNLCIAYFIFFADDGNGTLSVAK